MDTRMPTNATPAPMACASCSAALSGPWCAACGQRAMTGRHTLRRFFMTGLSHVLDLDRGFLHTLVRLSAAPGHTIRDYLDGATKRYTHPVAYLFIGFAAFAITGRLAGGEAGMADGGNRVFTATAVPFIAGVARLIFLRARLNYAEHLIATMYLLGHVVLGLAAIQALTPVVPLGVSMSLGLAGLTAGVIYFCWGYGGILGGKAWLGAVGGLAALGAGLALWAVALVRIVAALRSGQAP